MILITVILPCEAPKDCDGPEHQAPKDYLHLDIQQYIFLYSIIRMPEMFAICLGDMPSLLHFQDSCEVPISGSVVH